MAASLKPLPELSRSAAERDRNVGEPRRSRPSDAFRRIAFAASLWLGSHWAFLAAVVLVVGWAATGPIFHYSEGWQLVINTGTTVITFLMVFLIQATQNRDAKAIHLKLDELIRASEARNVFAALENATEDELNRFQGEFERLRRRAGESNEDVVTKTPLDPPRSLE